MTKMRVRKPHRDPVVQPQDNSIRYISLTRGKVAIVDTDDYEFLRRVAWFAIQDYSNPQSFYAKYGWHSIPMHRIIMLAEPGQLVDHINGDTLDNRKANLRIVTSSQNGMNRKIQGNNTSGVPGVTWHKRMQMWQVRIGTGKGRIVVGSFTSKEDAIRVRYEAEEQHHGEYASRLCR